MAPTSYPGAIDSFTDPTATQPQNAPSHSGQHTNANDAIKAIETFVGISGTLTPQEYWVSNGTLASDSNNGQRGAPFATFQHAVTVGEATGNAYKINLGIGNITISAADGSGNGVTVTKAASVIEGAGKYLTSVVFNTTLTYGICVKDATNAMVQNLRITTGAAGAVTYGVGVTTTGSCEHTHFTNVFCDGGAGTFTNVFAVGPDTALDVAETIFVGCTAYIGAPGVGGSGWLLGNGTNANVLNVSMFGCQSEGNYYNINCNGVFCRWYGGTLQTAGYSDVYISVVDVSEPLVIDGVRSEGSPRFLADSGNAGGATIELSNITFNSTVIAADGKWLRCDSVNTLSLRNITVNSSSGPLPIVEANASSNAPLAVIIDNLTQPNTLALGVVFQAANTVVNIRNYVQTNSSGTPIAITAQAVWGGDTVVTNPNPKIGGLFNIGRTAAEGGSHYTTKLAVGEATNGGQGIATLSSGTVVVSNTGITANSRIFLTVQSLGTVTAPSALCVSARTAGTSFTILASVLTDTSIIAYEIFEPASP
jgi:hypothetical protein